MTKKQIQLINKTWPEVEAVAPQAAKIFYARLFAIQPETSALFAAADMRSQRQKLMISLGQIVKALDAPPGELQEFLSSLGRRHVAYGVLPEHYDTVGEAMLWMLEKVLGGSFTKEVRAAWAAAYTTIARAMQDTPVSQP